MKHSVPPAGVVRPAAPRLVPSRQLLGEQGQLHIEHQGERYVLRITRQGKLILTK
jgi:hemin uptake protein HemP